MLEARAFGRKVARPATAKATVGSSSKEIERVHILRVSTLEQQNLGISPPPLFLKMGLEVPNVDLQP